MADTHSRARAPWAAWTRRRFRWCGASIPGLLAGLGLAVLLVACSDDRRLERDLHAQDPQTRATAIRRLAQRDRSKAVPVLVRMLDDRDPRVRVEAADGLGRLKATGAAKSLGALLRDTDARVRLAAVHALAGLGLGPSEDYLVGAVMDPNRLVRRAARNRLADLGLPRPEQQRRVVSRRIVRYRRDLVARLPERRAAAVKALGRSGRPEVVTDLEKLASDPYATVAQEASEALGMVGSAAAVAALERIEGGSQDGRRLTRLGMRTLLSAPHTAARALAIRLLSDADLVLRRAALGFVLHPSERAHRPPLDVLCRSLEGPAPAEAVAMAQELRTAGLPCPRVAAAEKRVAAGPVDVLGAITREEALAPAERDWISRQLALESASPDPIALAAAVLRGDKALRQAALQRVERAYRTLLELSERWLDESAWKRIDVLPVAPGGGTLLPPEPAPPAHASTGAVVPARAQRGRRLHQLLERFPDRSDLREEELMPPAQDPAGLRWALLELASLAEALPFLVELTGRGPLPLRHAAWEALKRTGCGTAQCLAAVDRALDATEAPLRAEAIDAVAKPGAALVERLVPLLQDADAGVRAAAAAALARSRSDRAFPALLQAFRRSRESHLVEAFGTLGDPRAERVLLGLLREDQDVLVAGERLLVIEALGRVGTAALTERLATELEHPEPALRQGAALVLGRLGDRRGLEPLLVCGQDFYRAVREACAQARAQVEARDRARP